MPESLVVADLTVHCADSVPSTSFVSSWKDDGLNAARRYLAAERDIASTPQLERTLSELRLRACGIVLDLLDLALVDRSDIDAIVNASIRARQAARRIAPLLADLDPDRIFTLVGPSDDVEIGCNDTVNGPTRVLLALAAQELIA